MKDILNHSYMGPDVDIISFEFNEEKNEIHVVKRIKSQIMYATYPPRPKPDHVWKEIYGVENNIIYKKGEIVGEHEPAFSVNEKFIFKD